MSMAILRKPDHFWPLLWAGACLALVGILALEYRFGGSSAGQGPRAPARVAEAKLLPAFRLSADSREGSQTTERPLFVPGRRSSPALAGGPGVLKKGQFILQGTTLVGSLSIAMLKEVSTGTIHRVEKGGEILGMKLAEVSAEQVVLKAGEDTETLELLVARGAGNAAAAVERGPFASPAPGPATPGGQPQAAPGSPLPAPAASVGSATIGGVPAAALGGRVTAGGLSVTPPTATPGSAAMTPEEIIARRRAARRPQPQN
ncbi:MAG: hypothetical protein AB7P08_09145 [Burkholderiales bacterium]